MWAHAGTGSLLHYQQLNGLLTASTLKAATIEALIAVDYSVTVVDVHQVRVDASEPLLLAARLNHMNQIDAGGARRDRSQFFRFCHDSDWFSVPCQQQRHLLQVRPRQRNRCLAARGQRR